MESHPSNVEMSWSKDVVRFVCHCVVYKISVFLHSHVQRFSMDLAVGCGQSIMVSCCNLLMSCAHSSACMFGLMVGSNWVSHSQSYWKCSCNSARSQQGSGSSLYSMDDSLSCLGILWFGGVLSRGAVCWGAGMSLVSVCMAVWFPCLIVILWVLLCFPKSLSTAIRGDSPQLWDTCVWICGCVENEGEPLTWQWLCWALLGGYHLCIMRGFLKHCQLNPVSCQVSAWSIYRGHPVNCSHYKVSHHSTSIWVQNVKVHDEVATLGFPLVVEQ